MRVRRRPPSLVSMWMLDVFCCALGCVTLLWLLSNRAAQEEATHNREAVELLARTEADLKTARANAERAATVARQERDQLQTQLRVATTERDALQPRLAAAQRDLEATRSTLTAAQDQAATTEADRAALAEKLETASTKAKTLADKLASVSRQSDDATEQLAQKRAEVARAEARADAANKALTDGQREMAAVGKEQRATGDTLRQTADELAQARATIVDLQGQKAKLADKFDKLQTEAEARFAGVSLTGRRVVFLIDISGSMKLIDDRTPAPDKWNTVIDTITRVMKSLPNLERFQAITFSRQANYLFPGGEWQEYRGDASIKQVRDALARVNPEGDTNLYDAFDIAFRQKSAGLDTIYLFSDGLPTSGRGLSSTDEQTLPAAGRSDRLAKFLLQTLQTRWNPLGANRVKINAVGFFFESPDVGAFLWALARENDGSFVGMSRP